MTLLHRLARRGLDALARRIAVRLPLPLPAPAPAAPDPLLPAMAQLIRDAQADRAVDAERAERALLLQGRIAAQLLALRLQAPGARLGCLADAEFRVSSQWGEDGIIEFLCQCLPGLPRSFVEFGVGDYREANTRFLLEHRGWRGLVMDSDGGHMAALRTQALHWRHDLVALQATVTAETVAALVDGAGFGPEPGLLSVDIDGNDYWVLQALDGLRPGIVVCEFNGLFGDLQAVSIPYRPDFDRLQAHHAGQYFGCSLAALQGLWTARGYRFVGTGSAGVNAFFVRGDLAEPVLARLEAVRAWAPGHRDSRGLDGGLDFVRGLDRLALVAEMPVVALESQALVALGELAPLYSDAFLQALR